MKKNENLLLYKKLVGIPSLEMIDDVAIFSECGIKAIKANTYVMSKIQSLKQWCGPAKCHQIHLGKPSITCPELSVHGEPMKKSELEKYLGDLVSKELTNKQNIENRQSKAMGIISQIMSLLSEICLGKHYYEIAMLLRETMFVNGILTNIEVCYGLTKE